MAYQPKFARKNHRVSPFFVLLGVIVVPISLALTAVLLGKMVQSVGHPKAAAQTAPADMTIMEQFDGFVSAKMDAARDTLTAAQTPENVPETTVPVREKVIIEIPDDAQVAPEPNPECYGQTDDPASLQWLLDEAAFLLDGQELYFSTDVELFEGSLVNYYLDDTIFAITWKEVHDSYRLPESISEHSGLWLCAVDCFVYALLLHYIFRAGSAYLCKFLLFCRYFRHCHLY